MPRPSVISLVLIGLLWLSYAQKTKACGIQSEEEIESQREKNENPSSTTQKDISTNEDPEVLTLLKERNGSIENTLDPDGQYVMTLMLPSPQRYRLSNEEYKILAKSRTAEELALLDVEMTDEGLAILAKMRWLKGITINSEYVTDAGLKSLAECQTLDWIELSIADQVTDAGIRELARLPKLESLSLSNMKLTGEAFAAFAVKRSLKRLELRRIKGLTEKGVVDIARLPGLNELAITYSEVTTETIKTITAVRVPFEFRFENNLLDDELFIELVKRGWLYGSNPADLKVLDLQGAKKLTDRGFAAIVKCTNLEEVSLVDTGITEASFQLLANCKRLEDVSLGNAQIKGARLSTLSHLPIKFLVIRESELADEHFQAIGKMTELRVLKLLESKFDPQSIKHLRNLNKVWFMSFFNTPFDDTSATHLISLPKLRWLLLDESQIGDAGLKELLESVQISTLTLNGTPVTKEAYQKAKLQYPQKLIRYDGYED